jgi:hypothetical protein
MDGPALIVLVMASSLQATGFSNYYEPGPVKVAPKAIRLSLKCDLTHGILNVFLAHIKDKVPA